MALSFISPGIGKVCAASYVGSQGYQGLSEMFCLGCVVQTAKLRAAGSYH